MPRRGSTSSRSTDYAFDRGPAQKKDLKKRLTSNRERRVLGASAPTSAPDDTTPEERSTNDLQVLLESGASQMYEISNMGASPAVDATRLGRLDEISGAAYAINGSHALERTSTSPSIVRDTCGTLVASYAGTGFSDDGRSLTPDPHSSEAETVHVLSEPEEEQTQARYKSTRYEEVDDDDAMDDDADEEESLEVPEDLDNLSDSDAHNDTRASTPTSEVLEAGEEVFDKEDEEMPASDMETNSPVDQFRQPNARSIIPEKGSADLPDIITDQVKNDSVPEYLSTSSPPRKRKRLGENSPLNAKRLAPRRVQAELDSDEDDDVQSPQGTALLERTNDIATEEPDPLNGIVPDLLAARYSPAQDKPPDGPADVADEEDEEEVEEEEPEEEGQDDTEREERNRHRLAAMDSLRQIEIDFARLRVKLYEERMMQIEREIRLAELCEHPLLVEKAKQNADRHSGRLYRAQVIRESRKFEAEVQFKARKYMAHSQFAQDRQKLRAALLSKTSAEWFQIHREKRILDITVPEYGYVLPERKSQQNKHRRERDAEVAMLAGLKKFIGFPAAPAVSVATSKEAEADLAEMGMLRGIGLNSRAGQALAPQQNPISSPHTSMNAHLNHSHVGHISHQQPHVKSSHHHHHHTSTTHSHPRHTPVPANVGSLQHYHTHAYSSEPVSRRTSNLSSASFTNAPNEQDRKPSHRAFHDTNMPREPDRDRMSFSSHASHQPIATFQQTGSQPSPSHFSQKQAQNLPNILRVDTPEKSKAPANVSQMANGNVHTGMDMAAPANGKAYNNGQFWGSKAKEQNTRPPAPAVSSNSAFNATLSQPGASASYIPPKTYSPANQPPMSIANGSKSIPSLPVIQPSSNKLFPAQGYSSLGDSPSGASPLYQPRAQQPSLADNGVLFGSAPPSMQELQK